MAAEKLASPQWLPGRLARAVLIPDGPKFLQVQRGQLGFRGSDQRSWPSTMLSAFASEARLVSATFARRSRLQGSQNDQRRPLSRTIDATTSQPAYQAAGLCQEERWQTSLRPILSGHSVLVGADMRRGRLDPALRVLASDS